MKALYLALRRIGFLVYKPKRIFLSIMSAEGRWVYLRRGTMNPEGLL